MSGYDHNDIKARVEAAFRLRAVAGFHVPLVDDVIEIVHSVPVPMRLHCPVCHMLHIDDGAFATKPHHTHACQVCGNTWRPAIVPTVGVRFLPGFKNEPSGRTCVFKFSDGGQCVSPTCHIDGKHYTEGVVP